MAVAKDNYFVAKNWAYSYLLIVHNFPCLYFNWFTRCSNKDKLYKLLSSVRLRCFSHCYCGIVCGTSSGLFSNSTLIEMYCLERLWHVSAPHDHIGSVSQPSLLDLLGHTDGSVCVCVCQCVLQCTYLC